MGARHNDPEDSKSALPQIAIASRILHAVAVLTAVDLDYQ
jgi:hypothetical protein